MCPVHTRASASGDNTLKLWDTDTEIRSLAEHFGIGAFQ